MQFEIMPRPPDGRKNENPWPQWPSVFRISSAHEEGGTRDYNVSTKSFTGEDGRVTSLNCVRVEWQPTAEGRPRLVEVTGSEFVVKAELVLLAMGFVQPQHHGLLDDLGVEYDGRGNVKTNAAMMTSVDGVFAAGDMQRGQSLVVHAIAEGRACARYIDTYLMGHSNLPTVRATYVR